MKVEPLCRMCLKKLNKVTPAKIADHILPHDGNQFRFWYGELQSLCLAHHSKQKAMLDRGIEVIDYSIDDAKEFITDIGDDGWPIDSLHPVYRFK
jgi:hypothetical protein